MRLTVQVSKWFPANFCLRFQRSLFPFARSRFFSCVGVILTSGLNVGGRATHLLAGLEPETPLSPRSRERHSRFQEISQKWMVPFTRLRRICSQIQFHQLVVDSYEGDGWVGFQKGEQDHRATDANKTDTLRASQAYIARGPEMVISVLHELMHAADDLKRIPVSVERSPGGTAEETYEEDDIFCTICSGDEEPGNALLLCDHADCDRGYHQRCVFPPVPDSELEDEDATWICPFCSTVAHALELLNEQFGKDADSLEELIAQLQSHQTPQKPINDLQSPSADEEPLSVPLAATVSADQDSRPRAKRERKPSANAVGLADLPPDDSSDSSFQEDSDEDEDEEDDDLEEDEGRAVPSPPAVRRLPLRTPPLSPCPSRAEDGSVSSPLDRRSRRQGKPRPDYVTMNMLLFGDVPEEDEKDEMWSPSAISAASASPSGEPPAKRHRR